jgi:hypothetical protein
MEAKTSDGFACMLLLSSQAKRKLTGIMNFTNPGVVSHNEVSPPWGNSLAATLILIYSPLSIPSPLTFVALAPLPSCSNHSPPPNTTHAWSVVPQILQMYKDYVDPEFTWSNFSIEEQAKVIVAPRSNNLLETKRVRGGEEGWG